jgi:RNA polymerase sigma-70 factor (ECF subfamily)
MERQHEDAETVRTCLDGHPEAFRVLVDAYHRQIFNLAFRITGSRDEAEEITQCVFVKAYERLSTYKPQFKFFSWLYRIGMNEALNSIRYRGRFEQIDPDLMMHDPSPVDQVVREEKVAAVQSALLALKLEQREVIVLRHFEDMSYSEIADALHLPEKRVKSRLFTARTALVSILKSRGIL